VIRSNRALFPKTPWKIFGKRERARRRGREHAIAELWRLYWKPLFGLLLSRRINPIEAEDLTQGFFLHLIESDAIARADPAKGRFRDFLVGALNHYLIDLRARSNTLKRGGGTISLSFDQPGVAESVNVAHQTDVASPQCDRIWLESLLESALDASEKQCAREKCRGIFRLLKSHLTGEESSPYEKLARRLRRSPATLRSDMKRLREKFRDNLREELRRRVGPERLEQEWETLREILRGKR
jgi:RNA polymerase sigma-70 factor (ECF subfamily)